MHLSRSLFALCLDKIALSDFLHICSFVFSGKSKDWIELPFSSTDLMEGAQKITLSSWRTYLEWASDETANAASAVWRRRACTLGSRALRPASMARIVGPIIGLGPPCTQHHLHCSTQLYSQNVEVRLLRQWISLNIDDIQVHVVVVLM